MRSHSSCYGYYPSRRKAGSPASVTVTAQTSLHQRPVFPKRLFGAYLLRLVTVPHLICTVRLADTQPHSPTALTDESIAHASIIGSSHAINGKADHALTCAYRLPSFPIVNLAHITLRFLIAFLTYIPMTHLTSSPSRRRWCHCVNRSLFFLSLDRCPLSTDDRTKQLAEHVKHVHNPQRDGNPSPKQTHQHHCEHCYDYVPTRCRSTVVMALFTFVIMSHDTLLKWTPYPRLMLVGSQENGDEVKADTRLRDIMRGAPVPPTTNPLPTRLTSFPPTASRPPVRLYIYIITYERAIHPLVFPSSPHS